MQKTASYTASESERRAERVTSHSAYVVMKRLVHTVLLSVAIAVALGSLLLYQQLQESWLKLETSQPGEPLARQYSKILQPHLQNKDIESLSSLLAILMQEEAVTEANVYDSRGQVVAPLEKYTPVVSQAYLSKNPPVTHVQDIQNESGQVIGYLRVMVDPTVILGQPRHLARSRLLVLGGCLFIAFVLGIYLTRGFYKARPALKRRLSGRTPQPVSFEEKRRE
ncbi:AhpA/YtjB family protein [Alteromonas sp. H39]|uniref:AhpA/YtjB family protein n=1 Tax=Alteromonas sp. H39 TaxID=3389876 RepID=UPI0039E06072